MFVDYCLMGTGGTFHQSPYRMEVQSPMLNDCSRTYKVDCHALFRKSNITIKPFKPFGLTI